MNAKTIIAIWDELKSTAVKNEKLRKVGEGIVITYDPSSETRKIGIMIDIPWDNTMFPKWSGVLFSMKTYALPTEKNYLVLELDDPEQSNIFAFVCFDLIDNMGTTKESQRDSIIQETISQWNHFFRENKTRLMSREIQQGLFAELKFLCRLLESDLISNKEAAKSWKGAERAYHDFQYRTRVVEVKSTTGKEPKMVKISNEKQLNDNNIAKLLLLATSLTTVDGGETLQTIVAMINKKLEMEQILQDEFTSKLLKYGLKMEEIEEYPTGYVVENDQSFNVVDGFPRIIEATSGVAEIKYSVVINSCSDFEFANDDLVGVFVND